MDGWPVWLASASLVNRHGSTFGAKDWDEPTTERVSASLDVLLDGIGDPDHQREFVMCITLCRHRALTQAVSLWGWPLVPPSNSASWFSAATAPRFLQHGSGCLSPAPAMPGPSSSLRCGRCKRLRGLSLKCVNAVSHHIRGRDADVIGAEAGERGYDGSDLHSRCRRGTAQFMGGPLRVLASAGIIVADKPTRVGQR